MSQTFDPYHVWLGIPPAEQPPNYYRLLGLQVFEPNLTVIDNAAQRAAAHLHTQRNGPHATPAQQLLEEISTAAICLLDPIQKTQYDQSLARQRGAPRVAPVPQPPLIVAGQQAAANTRRQRTKPAARGVPQAVKIIGGGVLGIILGYLIVYFATGRDLLGMLPVLRRPPPATSAAPKQATEPPRKNDSPPPEPKRERPPEADPNPQPQPKAPATEPPPSVAPPVVAAPPAATTSESQKLPQPTAEQRQKMLAELQTIYKAEFDRGSRPGGGEQLVSFLLETARKLKSDTTAQYVLYREAFDRALRQGDFATVADAIDELEVIFDIDGYRLRLHLLTEASKTARTPAERLPLVEFAFNLADYAQATDHVEDVAKLASLIDAHARSISRDIRSQFASRLSDLRKAADELVPIVTARQRLASDPADASASLLDGKYRCFVRGDWDAGLKLLAQSNHAALAAAARQDIAGATDPAGQAGIAESWFDLGMADPALLGALARARYWYGKAVKEAPALERVKLERRMDQIAAIKLPPLLLDQPSVAPPALPSARELLAGQTSAPTSTAR